MSVAVALRHLNRGDAFSGVRPARPRRCATGDLTAAARDYPAAIEVLDRLVQPRSIAGTDVKTLEAERGELARTRADLAAAR